MTNVIAGMTLSLDGYVADREGSAARLYPDFDSLQGSAYMEEIAAETGCVLMGRRTFDLAGDTDTYADTYEFQVPIVVLTHRPPAIAPKQNERLTFTFITDGVESAVAVATDAAGEKAVTVVGGADVILQLLLADLVNELSIDVMPIFLGDGLRLFDTPELERIRLELVSMNTIGERVSLRYRVVRQ